MTGSFRLGVGAAALVTGLTVATAADRVSFIRDLNQAKAQAARTGMPIMIEYLNQG